MRVTPTSLGFEPGARAGGDGETAAPPPNRRRPDGWRPCDADGRARLFRSLVFCMTLPTEEMTQIIRITVECKASSHL